MSSSFGAATFGDKIDGYGEEHGLLKEVTVGIRFSGSTEADALAALVTPRECYSLRATLDGTPILQRWGGGGINALTIPGYLTAEDALLTSLRLSRWLPGGRRHGTATFLLTAGAVEP